MNKELFNEKFHDKGGLGQLIIMKENLCTLKKIAEHFGVTRERVRQWMVDLFGDKYDPRYSRRQKKIDLINRILNQPDINGKDSIFLNHIFKSYLNNTLKEINENEQ